MRLMFAVLCLHMFVPLLEAAAPREAAAPPNVIIFITDDESWLERSAYGWSTLPTPAFDRVARDGVLFTHGYTSAPSCAPSRASLLTGRNFWELEQGAFIQAWLPKKFPVLPDLLKRAGYHVGHTGKGWGPGVFPDDGHGKDSAGTHYNRLRFAHPEEGTSGIDYAANFVKFLNQRPVDAPFFFWVGVVEPHGPWAENNWQKLLKTGFPTEDVPVPGFLPNTPGIRRERANILYEIHYADLRLNEILQILEEQNELDNTLLIVTSDNGTAIPRSKASPYDWGVHEPLAIMWPKNVPSGRVVEDFVNFPDLAPTILESAGVDIPEGMSGRSILNLLQSKKEGWIEEDRDFVVTGLEWHGEFDPINLSHRTIRDKRYAYIRNFHENPGQDQDASLFLPDEQFDETAETAPLSQLLLKHPNAPQLAAYKAALLGPRPLEELYDLEADPWQLTNQIDNPEFTEIRDRLKAKMHEYQLQTNDPRATGDMEIFEETREFVQDRKRKGYGRTK